MARKPKQVKEESLGEISEVDKVRRLEELLNIKDINPFGTEDVAKFEKNLEDMTIADMQRLCYDVGLRPMTNRVDIRKQLMDDFLRKNRSVRNGFIGQAKAPIDENDPKNTRLLKLLLE